MKVKLSKYLKPYALFAVLTPLSMVGEVLGDLLQPKLMSKIVDDGVLGQDMNLIIRTGLLMLLVLIGGGACGIAACIRWDSFPKLFKRSACGRF